MAAARERKVCAIAGEAAPNSLSADVLAVPAEAIAVGSEAKRRGQKRGNPKQSFKATVPRGEAQIAVLIRVLVVSLRRMSASMSPPMSSTATICRRPKTATIAPRGEA